MKKSILIYQFVIALMLSVFTAKAQSSSWQWAKGAGGPGDDNARSVASDKHGNVYTTGYITLGAQEIFISKYSPNGTPLWIKLINGTSIDRGNAITVDKNGFVYVTGNFESAKIIFGTDTLRNTGNKDIFLAKYDSLGNPVWARSAKGTSGTDEESDAITVDLNGDIYITGTFGYDSLTFGSVILPNPGGYVTKYSPTGNVIWAKSAYGVATTGITADGTGNLYIAGFFGGPTANFGGTVLTNSDPWGGTWDVLVYKFNAAGTVLWGKSAGSFQQYESAQGVAADSAGNVYVTGGFQAPSISFGGVTLTNNGAAEYFIVKYDPNGNVLWGHSAGGTNWDGGVGVATDKYGNAYTVGNFMTNITFGNFTLSNTSPGTYDLFVTKYDPSGYVLWSKSAGGTNTEYITGISIYGDKYAYIAGIYNSATLNFGTTSLTNAGNNDAFIAKLFVCSDNNYVPICMVTVDSLSKNNIIYWDKTSFTNSVDSFIIYREVSSNLYLPIGAVPFDSLSMFVDTARTKYFATYFNSGDPNSGTYRYKIAIRDTCGNLSELSAFHNTIFMINNNGTFSWPQLYTIENTPNPVGNYVLYRDDNNTGNWHGVNSVTGTQQTITDPQYANFQYTANWEIRTLWSLSCTPTYRLNGSSVQSTIVKSKSNITNNRAFSINKISANNQLSVFPNPTAGNVSLKSSAELGLVTIYNSLGEIIYRQKTKDSALQVDLSKNNPGIYIVSAQGQHIRIIKE